MARSQKTPHQRAEEALGVAERKCAKLAQSIAAAEHALADLRRDLAAAVARRDYLAQDPALRVYCDYCATTGRETQMVTDTDHGGHLCPVCDFEAVELLDSSMPVTD